MLLQRRRWLVGGQILTGHLDGLAPELRLEDFIDAYWLFGSCLLFRERLGASLFIDECVSFLLGAQMRCLSLLGVFVVR